MWRGRASSCSTYFVMAPAAGFPSCELRGSYRCQSVFRLVAYGLTTLSGALASRYVVEGPVVRGSATIVCAAAYAAIVACRAPLWLLRFTYQPDPFC